ncbi:GNAT family N-acetyltransferase [Cellulophaga sp. HaHaR_3_176]|uniref:GNAT family N-acetyltransferase n=1 Tax=Cellulophaga sp. HaHaR_3_176 TaxID=1942464 RepID=UPI001C1FD6B1|nr:GNAT family N-acetyltransferase [Cellulophaga sp. HaHaR_3_176]QWX83773.1 GNAT family N-acetyltransferase [Cellulophaga sp. HaHaR_3_176]
MSHFEETLKNPVWYSLSETHKNFVVNYNGVKFYDPKVCPFGAFVDAFTTEEALDAYAMACDSFFLVSETGVPTFNSNRVILDRKIEGCQMVLNSLIETVISETIVRLTTEHIDDIYDLVWLVMPGYYRKRTFEMGEYYGIFKDGKLVSVAGQRMQTDNFIEVSAVVTHPDYMRKGLAKQLVCYVTQQILKNNKKPILHTTKGNAAIPMYEKLGYSITRDMNWWFFHRK